MLRKENGEPRFALRIAKAVGLAAVCAAHVVCWLGLFGSDAAMPASPLWQAAAGVTALSILLAIAFVALAWRRAGAGMRTFRRQRREAARICRKQGHDWDGCVCRVCGQKRDEAHDWSGCVCRRCGARRDEAHDWRGCVCRECGARKTHDWHGCVCRVCGARRDEAHEWDGCRVCGQTRDEAHDWGQGYVCTVCKAGRPHTHDWEDAGEITVEEALCGECGQTRAQSVEDLHGMFCTQFPPCTRQVTKTVRRCRLCGEVMHI